MHAYLTIVRRLLLKLCSCLPLLAGSSAFAAWDGYLGAGLSVSHWQMGFASGKSVQLLGVEFQSNKPDPALYMGGVSASLVYNKTWALSYQGEYGVAYPAILLTNTDTSLSPPQENAISGNVNIFRMDQSLSLSRLLGATGFSVFIGAKLQTFGYTQPTGAFSGVRTGYETTTGSASITQNIITYGPAAGLGYTRRFLGKTFFAVQVGFIFFPGSYTADLNIVLNSQLYKNSSEEKFYGLGFTGIVSLIYPVTDRLLLQTAFRGQFYRAKTLSATATQGLTPQTTSVTGALDGTQDILLGLQLSAIYRIF